MSTRKTPGDASDACLHDECDAIAAHSHNTLDRLTD